MSSRVAPKQENNSKYDADGEMKDKDDPNRPASGVNKYLIDPNCDEMRYWDMSSIALLGFVMLVTPYEVAFLETGLNALFFINRLIDLFFVCDMVLQFFLMYRDEEKGILIKDQNEIIKNYMRCWMWIDIMSILPFDMIGYFMQSESLNKAKVRDLCTFDPGASCERPLSNHILACESGSLLPNFLTGFAYCASFPSRKTLAHSPRWSHVRSMGVCRRCELQVRTTQLTPSLQKEQKSYMRIYFIFVKLLLYFSKREKTFTLHHVTDKYVFVQSSYPGQVPLPHRNHRSLDGLCLAHDQSHRG